MYFSASFCPVRTDESASDTAATELLFRKSFYEGTELDSIEENDSVRFSYVSTVHSPSKPVTVAVANSEEDLDSDTCIVGELYCKFQFNKHCIVWTLLFRFY